jgi:hypothetical protein
MKTLFFNILILISLVMIASQNIYSQRIYFIDNYSAYKYYIGTTEPSADWNKTDFDDSGWIDGRSSIGYGDNDDTTIIEKTSSVYIRYHFTTDEYTMCRILSLYADFDDGFVAYLNGVEIARMNLGEPGEYISHNRLTDMSHEAQNYRGYFAPVNAYYIDSTIVKKSLLLGENVLAVQVHNDSLDGSDLSFICRLLNLEKNVYYSFYEVDYRYRRQLTLDSTNFPIVSIYTDEFGIPYPNNKYIAYMGIINNADGSNKPTDNFNVYNGRISINLRGQTSLYWPKKQYRIETQDSAGENLNVSLLGMPPDNDWILYGPFGDKSLIRNEMAFVLGRKLGYYQPRTRFCELLVNGEDMGLYVLTEKIKRDANRVNIANLRATDITGIDVTGGYIVRYDKGSNTLQYVDPDEDEIMPEQQSYINSFYKDFFAVLNTPNFLDPLIGYKKYIDDQSLIDYIIINEVMRNCDAYLYSTYMYKDRDDRDGRIKFGPLWDFDFSMGNVNFQDAHLTNGWQFAYSSNNRIKVREILRDTIFVDNLNARWVELRNSTLSNDSLMFIIDSLTQYIEQARIRNYTIWPVIQYPLSYYDVYAKNYDEEISKIKSWLTEHLSWMDENMPKIYYKLPVFDQIIPYTADGTESVSVYPNPFTDKLYVEIYASIPGQVTFELYDILGKKIYSNIEKVNEEGYLSYVIDGQAIQKASNGVYQFCIRNNNKIIAQIKLIKQ